jgi:hypothetical protein
MIPRSISLRLVGIATALLLLVSAVAAPPALARAACNNDPTLMGTADIAVTQAISGTTLPNGDPGYLDHVTITNYGPCNVPNAALVVNLPATAQFKASSSNPTSWTCTGIDTSTVNCSETSTIGVPGTAEIYISYTLVAGTTIAEASSSLPDAVPGNNKSYAGTISLGTPLTYGPATGGLTDAFNHSTSLGCLSAGCGGFAQIYQTPASADHVFCPSQVPDCFLGTITIETTVAGPKSWTLSFLASLAGKKALSQITVWNSDGGAFGPVPNCNAKLPPDKKCVQDRSRATINGVTVYTIVVVGTVDNGITAN